MVLLLLKLLINWQPICCLLPFNFFFIDLLITFNFLHLFINLLQNSNIFGVKGDELVTYFLALAIPSSFYYSFLFLISFREEIFIKAFALFSCKIMNFNLPINLAISIYLNYEVYHYLDDPHVNSNFTSNLNSKHLNKFEWSDYSYMITNPRNCYLFYLFRSLNYSIH